MVVPIRKVYSLGEFTLEPDKNLLSREGVTVRLANRPFQVLLHLIENRDRMVSRAELLDLFWDGKDVYENTLTKCVGTIRKALDDTLEQPRFIETQWAKGYRFVGALEESFSQIPRAAFSELERTRGFHVIVEEEYVEIPAPQDAIAQANLLAEQAPATSAAQPIKAPRAEPLRRVFIPVALAVLVGTAIVWLTFGNRADSVARRGDVLNATALPLPSIAVLPLKNLSDDTANEYFSDGLTETFITELSKIDGLKVISRNSVFTFKGKDIDPRDVGKKLDVAAVLEGSVRRQGDTIRVDVRLVSTADGSVIWSGNSYDRALKDILAVQDEIACSVAAGLRVKFCKETEGSKRYTSNVDAYQAYLKGRFHWNKRTPEGIRRSVDHFEQAIALDPNYALAYAGLADSYIQGIFHVPFDPKEVLPKAKTAALRAIEIDEQLAEIHTALANIYQMEWQWADAEKEMSRAISLNPGLARAYHVRAFQMDMAGRHEDAVVSIKQAQKLDPLNLVINADMSFILWTAGHADEAFTQALKVVEMDPNFAMGHQIFCDLYMYQGNEAAAAEEYFKTMRLNGKGDAQISAYRKAFEKKGMRGVYQKELEARLQDQQQGRYVSLIIIAQLYTIVGQPESAFKSLEKAYNQRSAEMGIAKNSPYFAPLHSDPRYQDLLRRIGLSS